MGDDEADGTRRLARRRPAGFMEAMNAGGAGGARPALLAHRGDHRRERENALGAFRAALGAPGLAGIELDVRSSAGGIPTVLHDPTLARVHHRPEAARAMTAAELREAGIPTLDEVLAIVSLASLLDVELKEDVGSRVVEVIEARRGAGTPLGIVISSFERSALLAVRRLRPAWPLWLNADQLDQGTMSTALELGCAGVSVEWRCLTHRNVADARAVQLSVAGWTVRTSAELAACVAFGLDALCIEGEAVTGLTDHDASPGRES